MLSPWVIEKHRNVTRIHEDQYASLSYILKTDLQEL